MYNLKKVISNETVLVSMEDKASKSSFILTDFESLVFWDNFTEKFISYSKKSNSFSVVLDIKFMDYKPIVVDQISLTGDSSLGVLNRKYLTYLLKKYKIEVLIEYERPDNNIEKLDDIINILENNNNNNKSQYKDIESNIYAGEVLAYLDNK